MSLPGISRCAFLLGWTPKLDENELFRMVMIVGKQTNTTSDKGKNGACVSQWDTEQSQLSIDWGCSHGKQGFC